MSAMLSLGLLAGADRIEGTLFGNGERTGNVDIITLAMNMFSYGIDPKLDFANMPEIREKYERLTRMQVNDRAAVCRRSCILLHFPGRIRMPLQKAWHGEKKKQLKTWTVPYLPIDPMDVGRTYDSDVIRINSQSGKGGISYILKQNFSISMPVAMREEVGYAVKQVSDEEHKELSPQWVYEIFEENYVNRIPYFTVGECHFKQNDGIMAEATH